MSEMISGIDLIKSQILVASGQPLPFSQADIKPVGAAIECRINAEDPDKNFMPCPGRIEKMFIPGGLGVRVDSHAHAGYTVPPFYDSMIAKIIVHRPTREQAIECMLRSLAELRITGIKTTAGFHATVLKQKEFSNGTVDTKWVERELLPRLP